MQNDEGRRGFLYEEYRDRQPEELPIHRLSDIMRTRVTIALPLYFGAEVSEQPLTRDIDGVPWYRSFAPAEA